MFNLWDIVEELAAVAYERHSKRISMSQIRRQLKGAKQDTLHDVEAVRKMLIQLGYHVEAQIVSSPSRSPINRRHL